jgi:hypothetical protein
VGEFLQVPNLTVKIPSPFRVSLSRSGTFAFDRLREAIIATLETLAAGKITAKELPIDPKTNTSSVRYAPGYASIPPAERIPSQPYTIDGLAKFLGEVKDDGHAQDAFRATFGALELIDGNGLKESDIAGLEVWKVDAVVSHARGRRFAYCAVTRFAYCAVTYVIHNYFGISRK